MTRQEITHQRPTGFSYWCRQQLKKSTDGLIWQDIDGFFMDYKRKRFLLVEYKQGKGHLEKWQKEQLLFRLFNLDFPFKFERFGSLSPSRWLKLNGKSKLNGLEDKKEVSYGFR
jgi:hypothetical protein